MPLNANPHFYDSFAGFDTSTLYNNGAFAASALTSGTGGKAVADAVAAINAVDHVTATNNAIALIKQVAADNGVSPVTSLFTFIHELVALNHDTNLVQYIGVAVRGLVSGTSAAVTAAADATAAAIVLAQISAADAVAAGGELSQIFSTVQLPGGGDGGGPAFPAIITQVKNAVGGALTVNQAIDIYVGMPLGYAGIGSSSQTELKALIGLDASRANFAIAAFATAIGRADSDRAALGFGTYAVDKNETAATFIAELGVAAGLSTAQVNAAITGAIGSSLTAAQAVVLLSHLSGGAPAIVSLIGNGISAAAALGAIAIGWQSPGTAITPIRGVVAAAPADTSLQMVAAGVLAGLVGPQVDVYSVISSIASLSGSTTPEGSLSMLAAVGALGNVLSSSQNKYSLQLIGDAIRVDMNNGLAATAAVAALTAGFTSLGLSVDQQVTILAGTGGIAQLNSSFQYVGEPALKAAAAAQIYALIQANSGHLTAQQLATDFANAMTSDNIFWPQIIDILIRVAGSDTGVSGLVGGALTDLIGLSPFASSFATASVIQYIHADSVFLNQIITGDQTAGILIGMAGTGGIAIQIAAGGELGSLMQSNSFLAGVAPATNIVAALSAHTLTTSQATLFLAAAAGNANTILVKGVLQNAYTDLVATLVSADDAATAIADVHGAVVASALTADKALFFLAALGANSTGATQTAAANAILALATEGLVDAAHAIGVLAGAAGTVGTTTTFLLVGEVVGSPTYNTKVGYQNTFQEAIGAQIALLATTPAAGLSAQAAIDAIDAAVVTTHKLTGADAVRVLMGAAASDATIEPLAQAEIINLIGANTITSAQVVAVLQGMLTGASTAIQTVVNNELGLLIADFNTLDATAGTGNSAQIRAAAIAIDTLLNGSAPDPANGQTVLNDLGARITGATLTSAAAIELLLDLAGRSPVGLAAAIAELQTLSTPIGQGFGIVRYDTVINTTGTMLAAGTLSSNTALAVLGSFSIYNSANFPYTQTTLAAAIGTGATHITIAQIDAAVQAGVFPAGDAIGALGKFGHDNGGSLQAQAIAEIITLATDQPTKGLAVQALANIITSLDQTIRSAGYTALNAFLASSNESFAAQAFALVAPHTRGGDAVANSDAMAELVTLASLYGGRADVTGAIGSLITTSVLHGGIAAEAPWLQVLVNLLDVSSVDHGVLFYLHNRAHDDLFGGAAFTVNTIISDIAVTYGDNTARSHTTALELQDFLSFITPADMVSALGGASLAEQTNVLTALRDLYGPSAPSAFTDRLAQLGDRATYIAGLIQSGSANAMQLAISSYSPGAPADFLALIEAIASKLQPSQIHGITDGLVALAGTPSMSAAGIVQILGLIGTHSSPSLQQAAEASFANALLSSTFDSTSLTNGLSGLVPSTASWGQVIAFLADVYLARLETASEQGGSSADTASVKSQVIAEMQVLTQGLGGVNPGSIALAAATDFANIDEALALGDFIETVLEAGSANSTETIIAQSIGAAVPTISGAVATRILVSLAGHRGGNFLLPAGAEIATLVGSGAVTAGVAGFDIYAGFAIDHVMTQAQSIQVAIGAASGRGSAVAGEAFANLLSHNFATASDIATALGSAVTGHSITALQAIDIAAAMATGSLGVLPSATLLDAILATGLISGQGATAQLATHIGQSGFTVDTFMALVADAAAGTTAAARASIGVGLAELIAAGTITAQQLAAGLDLAVNGNGIGISPSISIDVAMQVLAGAAADSSSAAVQVTIVTQIGGVMAGLIANNATYGQSAMIAITNAAPSLAAVHPFDAHAALRSLLASIANAGSATAVTALGKELAALEHAGTLNVPDLFNIPIVAADKAVFIFASALILDRAPEDANIRTQAASIIASRIASNAITASAAYAQVGAANAAQGGSAGDLLAALVKIGQNSGPLGLELYRLVANGTLQWNDVVAASPGDFAFISFAVAANAAQAASPSAANAALQDDVYSNMLSRPSPTDLAQFLGSSIAAGGTDYIGVEIQLALRGDLAMKTAVGTVFGGLYSQNQLALADVQSALNSAAATAPQSALIYASMLGHILPNQIGAVLDKIGALATPSNTASIVAAIHAAIAPTNSTVGLSIGDAITALTGLAVTNATPAMLTAIAAEIAGLVTAGRLTATDADYYIGNSATNSPANEQYPRAALLAYLGSALGQNVTSFVNTIGLASVSRGPGNLLQLTADQVIALYAKLVDNAGVDPYGINTLYPTMVATIAASLPPPHWTTQFAAMSQLGDAEKMAFLVQVAESGGPLAQVEAGRAAGANIPDWTLALQGQPVPMTQVQTVLFLASYLLASPVNASEIGSILVGGYALPGGAMTLPANVSIPAIHSAATTFVNGAQVLSGADAGRVLAWMMPTAISQATFNDRSYYNAIMAEYRTLLGSSYVSASNLASALLAQVGTGDDSLRSTTGQILASLYQSGNYSQGDLVSAVNAAVGANTLTAFHAVEIFAAMANTVGDNVLSHNLGDTVGSMITGGQISIAQVISAIDAVDQHTAYVNKIQYGEFALLTRAAHYLTPAQDRELGRGFGTLLAFSNYTQPILGLIDLRTNPGDTLSVGQTTSLLRGFVSAAAGLAGNVRTNLLAQTAQEFARLVSSGRLTASAAIQGFDQEITAHTLPVDAAIAALTFMVANDRADLLAGVAAEMSALINSGRATSSQVLDALLAASGTVDLSFAPAGTEAAVAAILDGPRSQGMISTADIITRIDGGAVSNAHGLAILVPLAATSDAPSRTLIGNEIAQLVMQGRLSGITAGLAIKSAVSAATLSVNSALSLFMTIAHAGGTANNIAAVMGVMTSADVAPAAQIIATLQAAVTAGTLSTREEVAILVGVTASTQLVGAAIGAEFQRLILTGAVTASQLFAEFETDANAIAPGGYFQQLGYSLSAIGNTSDVGLQIAVGNEVGRLILQGKFTLDFSNTRYPVPSSPDITARFTSWLATAQTVGTFVQADIGYSIGSSLRDNVYAASDIYPALEHAMSVGAIDGAHLIGVLAASSSLEISTRLAVPTSAVELVSLISRGLVSLSDVVAGVDAVASTGAASISTWLTIASQSSSALAGVVPGQIQAFITEGRLSDAAALNAVTAAFTPVGPRASAATVVKVLVGLSSIGDTALQKGAGAKLAGLVAANFTATQILANVDTAATAHTMPGVNAVNVMLSFLSAMPNGGAGTYAASYVSSHIQGYVTAGLLTGAAAASALLAAVVSGPAQIAPFAGGLLVGISGVSAAISTIHTAVTAGTLNAHQAVQMLGGVAGGGGTAAATAEIQAMVNGHQITMSQVIQDFQTAGATASLPTAMFLTMAASADAAGRAAIASVIAGRGTHFGPSSDPFFSGALQQAALDFIEIANGAKTVDQAMADIKQYAPAHHASTDAGLFLLEDLLNRNNLFSSAITVHQTILDRLALGYTGAELAERVAEGEALNKQRTGLELPADGTAISYTAARTLLHDMVETYGAGSMLPGVDSISSLADFALDVSLLKINLSSTLFNGDFVPGYLQGHLVQFAMSTLAGYQGLDQNQKQGATSSKAAGYAVDQALLALMGQLAVSSAPNAASNLAEARQIMGARVLKGPAETDLVNQVANGTLTTDQALAALDALLAPVIAGVPAASATLARQTALGWLAIKSAQYIEGNYKVVTDAHGVKTIQTFSDNVNLLLGTLRSFYSDDVLAGLGGILRNGSASITADDRATDMKIVQTILGDVADASVAASSGGRMLTTNAQIKAASDQAMQDTADKFNSFTNGFLALNTYFGLPGLGDVVSDPRNLKGYVDLGTQIAAGGLPFTFGVSTPLPDLTGATYDELLGEGVGGELAIVGTAAKVVLFVLGFNAVSNALGPLAPTLRGLANVTAATTDLLGNIVTGVVTAGKDAYWAAGRSIGITLSDLGQGNFGDLQGDAEATALALFTTASGGFTPATLGAVEDSGRSIGAALVDLSSGNPEAAGRDAIALGLNVIKVLQSNIYFHAAATAIQNYASQIADDLIGAANFTAEFFDHVVHGTLFTHPVPPQNLVRDLSSAGTAGYKNPHSFSSYGDFYHAHEVDGYISGATVFVDANGNGVLDPGEYSTTTDANGSYDLPAGIIGSIVAIGGTDTSTGLAFNFPLSAPNGSTALTALTTLVQKIAAANGSDLIAANQQVAAAFGLDPSIALTQADPVAAVRAGEAGGGSLVLATTAVLNTLILLDAAGATGDPAAILAAQIGNAAFGTRIDLTSAATIADLASASGVSAGPGAAVALLASASNTLLTNLINSAPDAATLLDRATAVTLVAQGETATALTNAGDDPTLLANVVNQYTGTNLTNNVLNTTAEVQLQPADSYYGPPRWYLDPTITGVVSTGSASGNSLSGSQSNQQMQIAFHDAAGSPSSAFTPTSDLLTGSVPGLAASLDSLFHPA